MKTKIEKQKEKTLIIRKKLTLVLTALEPFLLYKYRKEDLSDMYFPPEISGKLKGEIINQLDSRITLLRNNAKESQEQIKAFEINYSLLKGECFLLVEEFGQPQQ